MPGSGTDTGDSIINKINQIANIINPDSSSTMTSIGIPASKNEICDKGEPYLINGMPQTCTSTVCPNKFHCVFSKRGKNYYCCSKEGSGLPGAYGCPSGDALLFPSTGTPVQCSPDGNNSCPSGFNCLPHSSTGNYQCCSAATQSYSRKIKKRGKG
jgi:hypothetical protein